MSIYNIALYAAIAVISLVFAGGLYCFALVKGTGKAYN